MIYPYGNTIKMVFEAQPHLNPQQQILLLSRMGIECQLSNWKTPLNVHPDIQ